MALRLSEHDQSRLAGEEGPALALAMRIVVRVAHAMRAEHLLDIESAHIDSCLYHGRAGLDFARRLADDGGVVAVPTTLNVSSLDLLHPELYRGDAETAAAARELMDCYERMGCEPTWTCAPYQREERPAFGTHVAWAESNAIVFANSVLGARTHRYGDFIDICAALTGRAPAAGLHLDENRRATVVVDTTSLSDAVVARTDFAAVAGHALGPLVGERVPVVIGLGTQTEDAMKAFGSAAASSGGVGMFHIVGSTPEAPSVEAAVGGLAALAGAAPPPTIDLTDAMLRDAWHDLSTTDDGVRDIGAISLGTPHYSVEEFRHLVACLGDASLHPSVAGYVSTGREVLTEITLRGWTSIIESAGMSIVTDTCTYITPIMDAVNAPVMTDSAKWAYYAPGNLGVDVVFGTTEECVEAAVCGRVSSDRSFP